MVAYKNQHYLPEFYFSFFSRDGASIEMYNLSLCIAKRKGYKKLCAESYFYASIPDFEINIHELENKFYEVLLKIIERKKLSNQDYIFLLYFIAFQSSRTKKEKSRSEFFLDKFAKVQLKESYYAGELWEKGFPYETLHKLDTWTIKGEGMGSSSISHMTSMYLSLLCPILLADLKSVLLINNTDKEFFFSDNPIVIYNKFFYNKRRYLATGFASHGLQIFCPINPRIMLVLYDNNFYNFNDGKKNVIFINAESDIESLNSLQFFNCDENIFFSDASSGHYIAELHSKLKSSLDKKQSEYEWFFIWSSSLTLKIDDFSKEGQIRDYWVVIPGAPLVYMAIRGPNRSIINYDLDLSFMSIKTSPNWEGICRSPALVEECDRSIEKQMAQIEDMLNESNI